MFSFIGICLYSLSYVVVGTDPVNNVWCQDNTRYSQMEPSCVVQGVLFLVFGLATLLWWAISSINLFLQVVKKRKDVINREIIAHVFAWGIPIILASVGLGLRAYGFYYITPLCFVHAQISDLSLVDYSYILFYYPGAVLCIISVLCIGITSYHIIKYSNALKEHNIHSLTRKANIRLFFWCCMLLLIFVGMAAYRVYLTVITAAFINDTSKWIACEVLKAGGFPTTTTCIPPTPVNFGFSCLIWLVFSSIGTVTFLCFGASPAMFKFWKILWTLIKSRQWHEISNFIHKPISYDSWSQKLKDSLN